MINKFDLRHHSVPLRIKILSWRYFWIKWYVDAQTERGITRDGATKKREISHNLLSINLNFSVHYIDCLM